MKKLLFFIAEDRYFCTHRLNLGKAALAAGFEVAIATRCVKDTEKIKATGIQVFPLKHFNRGSLNPISQLQTLREISKIYKTFSPDIVHQVGLKPVIFGSVVAHWQRIPKIVNALSGLGYLFTDSKRKTNLLSTAKKSLLRFGVSRLLQWLHTKSNVALILQNQDDLDTLSAAHIIHPKQVSLIRGAGVDTQAFPATPLPDAPPIHIVCIARMLWDKGIGELIEAAKMIQQKNLPVPVRFTLYGMPDSQNPASISIKQLQIWNDAGIVSWNGYCDDVVNAYANCHIAVLPSYREGLPKSLLEAASIGRAIVTTDVPGCREVVQHGKNGLLVPAQNAKALAQALITLIQEPALQLNMGLESRKLVEEQFSDTLVNEKTITLYSLR